MEMSVTGFVMVSRFVWLFVAMTVVVREVDVELDAGDRGFLLARNVEVIAVQLEFFQLPFEFGGVHPQVKECGDEHIAGDAAENVEVKGFH